MLPHDPFSTTACGGSAWWAHYGGAHTGVFAIEIPRSTVQGDSNEILVIGDGFDREANTIRSLRGLGETKT